MSQERTRDDNESLWDRRQRALSAPIREVAERAGARLKQTSATKWQGGCPACGGTDGADGFSIDIEKGRFACTASGATGDVLAMARHALALRSNVETVEWILAPPHEGERRG